jgi:hypothetical protein
MKRSMSPAPPDAERGELRHSLLVVGFADRPDHRVGIETLGPQSGRVPDANGSSRVYPILVMATISRPSARSRGARAARWATVLRHPVVRRGRSLCPSTRQPVPEGRLAPTPCRRLTTDAIWRAHHGARLDVLAQRICAHLLAGPRVRRVGERHLIRSGPFRTPVRCGEELDEVARELKGTSSPNCHEPRTDHPQAARLQG